MVIIKNIKRHLWLLSQIYTHGRITRDDVNQLWQKYCNDRFAEIPRRTFERHLNELQNLFNINIRCNEKFEYYIANPRSLQQKTLQNVLVENLLETYFLSRSKCLGNKVQVEEDVSLGLFNLSVIGDALEENKKLIMTYQETSESEPYIVEIEPYCLKQKDRHWYLVASADPNEKVKTFPIDGIKKLEMTNKKFIPIYE